MGVNLRDIIEAKEIKLADLSGKKIGIDACNWTYQFLSTIRLRTGELLTDSKGRTTSHLIGLFNRTTNLLAAGIKPCYVWDGKPPELKRRTIEAREKTKQQAQEAFDKAETEDEKRRYAQQLSRLTPDMISDANKMLDLMGVPQFKAPGEGEAQISHMVAKKEFWACASQDWDSLLFGSNLLVRNLSISGKKRVPRTKIFKTVNPEIIDLHENLHRLGLTREQLVLLAMLVGTDYHAGVKGLGPKKSLALVQKEKTFENICKAAKLEKDAEEIFNLFMKPNVTDNYVLEWKNIDSEKLVKLLVDEHNFSQERVESQLKTVEEKTDKKQTGLHKFF